MAAETRKSRKSNFSQEEVDVLVKTVMQNHDILYKETSKSFFHKEIRNQVWNIILEEVNKVAMERRTLNEIKNKWKKCQYSVKVAENLKQLEHFDEDGSFEEDLDSMPLEKRLSQNHNELPDPVQETVLQSQSISPTKLKVTRQGRLNVSPQVVAPPLPPEVCLKWNTQHINMQSAFPNLLMKGQYVDATLVSEGKTMKCHRMVLSMCSPYFEDILNGIGPFQHPVLFMKDVPFWILKSLCDFMYAGEIRVLQDKLDELLNVATLLKIKGLAGIPESAEQVKTNLQNSQQESESFSKIHNKPSKLEEEKPPPPTPRTSTPNLLGRSSRHHYAARFPDAIESPKPLSHSRRREEKKVKLATGLKDKGKTIEQNAPQNLQANVSSTSKRMIRPAHTSRRKCDKNKIEINITEEEKEKPLLKKDNINDPLDLLQPVYEEIAKDETLAMVKNVLARRLKERSNVPTKKGTGRKVRKRRYIEYKEDLDDSSPTPFQSRKGTRSRPNVKVPKFFHSPYDDSPKDSSAATIVREPHTNHNDPLTEEIGEIKVEPVDVEENSLSWTPQDQEEEEIMGNYDSPLVNIATLNSPNTSGMTNIKENLQVVVDINQFNKEMNESIVTFNSTESAQVDKSGFMITNIQSMAEVPEEPNLSDNGLDNSMEDLQSSDEVQETTMDIAEIEKVIGCVAVKPLECLTLDPGESRNSGAMIYPTILPQVEADPLAQIGGPEANHESGSENTQIEESRQDISVLEEDNLETAAEDSIGIVRTRPETVLPDASKVVLKSQEVVKDDDQIESLNIGEINDDDAAQIEETQTFAEEKMSSEASTPSTNSAVAIIKTKESAAKEKGTFEILENLRGSEETTEETLVLTEKIKETCDEHKKQTLIDSIGETKNNAVEDSNGKENLVAPSRENVEQLYEETSDLNKNNLEPKSSTLLSVDTFNNEDIAILHIPEPRNETDEGQNNVELIEDSNLDLSVERKIEEVTKHATENVKAELHKSVNGEQKKVAVENIAVLIQQETESNLSIQPEQCSASSSTTMSPKISERGPNFDVQLLPIKNIEDFTKDIELDNFTPSNIHANNLGDSESDFDMKEAGYEKSESKKPVTDGENETVLLDYKNDEKEHARINIAELLHKNELDVAQNLETESILDYENLVSDNNSSSSDEVDVRMEECLLVDLDEEMEEATTSQIEDDGTEKTLEMIVNDLNESLGEMK